MRRTILHIVVFVAIGQFCLAAAVHTDAVQIRNGFVVLNASVNGKTGHYILDSGAPGLVANSHRHHTELSNNDVLHGVNGPVSISTLTSWNFRWNKFSLSGRDAFAVDLSYLESSLDMEIDGIVGLDVFSGYYVVIDYARGELELWRNMPETSSHTAWVEFPVEMDGHVPVVTLTWDRRQYKFGIDTGAESNLIDGDICQSLTFGITRLEEINLMGINQQKVKTSEIQVDGFTSKALAFPKTNFVMTDLSQVAAVTGVELDGILGQPFLSGRIVLFDKDRSFLRISNVILSQDHIADSPIVLVASR